MNALRVGLLALLILIALRVADRYGSRDLRILFMDVGQGDSALIRFPGQTTWLIDAGNGYDKWNAGRSILFPELGRLGVLTLDVGILSHPDNDHLMGFYGVAEGIRLKEFWMHDAYRKHPKIEALRNALTNTRFSAWEKPTTLRIGNVRATLLPITPPVTNRKSRSTNNIELVVKLEYAGCSILFAGDSERTAERSIAEILTEPVTALKVAHHGSKTSSTAPFLDMLSPQLAVISSGERNTYGHPHPTVLWRLKRRGIETFRTDFHGFVEWTVKPSGTLSCRTFHGSCGEYKCLK